MDGDRVLAIRELVSTLEEEIGRGRSVTAADAVRHLRENESAPHEFAEVVQSGGSGAHRSIGRALTQASELGLVTLVKEEGRAPRYVLTPGKATRRALLACRGCGDKRKMRVTYDADVPRDRRLTTATDELPEAQLRWTCHGCGASRAIAIAQDDRGVTCVMFNERVTLEFAENEWNRFSVMGT